MVLAAAKEAPHVLWCLPFAALVLSIAVLPLIPRSAHWWHSNFNKLLVSLALAAITVIHYATRDLGFVLHFPDVAGVLGSLGLGVGGDTTHPLTEPGAATALGALFNAVWEYVPFITVLLALYCTTGGILVKGHIPATPRSNTALLALGGLLASFVGTTGASMLLVRLVLAGNAERKHKVHTFVFFILIVSNAGGMLLPIGDPPLFLGYIKGVPFLWTLSLWDAWAFALACLLAMYYVLDRRAYARETRADLIRDAGVRQPIRISGAINFLWLVMSVLAVALVVPGKAIPGTSFFPPTFMREGILLVLIVLSFVTTPRLVRSEARFSFFPILEVAALFIGIFITMQPALEVLAAHGGGLGLDQPWQYFWACGALSAVLDNAPTYGVFFQVSLAVTAGDPDAARTISLVSGEAVRTDLLRAVSLGAVLFGAMTYIGNGPNFMVKAICEEQGVRMPSFFAYALWSAAVLTPIFVLISLFMV